MSTVKLGEPYAALGSTITIETPSSATGGQLVVVRSVLPAGASAPLHRHATEHETFVILKGSARFLSDGEISTAKAGETVTVPGGSVHSYRTLEPTEWIILTSGQTSFDEFVAEAAAAQPEGGPPNPAVLAPIALKHKIELLGPPPAELV